MTESKEIHFSITENQLEKIIWLIEEIKTPKVEYCFDTKTMMNEVIVKNKQYALEIIKRLKEINPDFYNQVIKENK